MWDTIRKSEPAALLMMGDNVYIDQPQFSLCQHYCYQRRQERSEWRRLVAGTPTYSIYDDHDFGTNDCVPGRGRSSGVEATRVEDLQAELGEPCLRGRGSAARVLV